MRIQIFRMIISLTNARTFQSPANLKIGNLEILNTYK